MNPATWPRDDRTSERLLVVERGAEVLSNQRMEDLPDFLRRGDLLVVNDAATLPACLHGTSMRGALEVRLLARLSDGAWSAILFGTGDWRTKTEDRPAPPRLVEGDAIRFGDELGATVRRVSGTSARLVELELDRRGAPMWLAIYALGRPAQYSYLRGPLSLWHVQTSYASRPWSAEMPSAGRPLTFALLLALRRRGVAVATLTHAAGLSSTGDPALDAALPLAERYEIPAETAAAIQETKGAGGRVIATGTSVVRAIEGCVTTQGRLVAGPGETDLVIRRGYAPRVIDGLLTGMHEPSESHFSLLEAFVDARLLGRATVLAGQAGYLTHEFGDSMLVL